LGPAEHCRAQIHLPSAIMRDLASTFGNPFSADYDGDINAVSGAAGSRANGKAV
jgi:hypothetical protein